MSSGPTYYDFFGVRPNASFAEIRSAYLWLMKQHHPDRTDHQDRQKSADFAAMVNRSYAVLKDPLTRARYDAWLASDARQRGNARVRRALLTGETRRRRETKWDSTSKAAAALAAVVVLLAGAVIWAPEAATYDDSDTIVAGVAYQPYAGSAPTLGEADVRRQVRLAMTASPADAERASQSCFASARDAQSLDAAQACIIFDDAFAEWNRTTSDGLARRLYFDDSIVRLRHRDALASAGSFADARLDQLRQASVNAMLAEIKSEVHPGTNTDQSVQNVVIRDKLSQ